MRTLATLADALNFGLECEARSRFADAEALYRRLLRKGVSGTIGGSPARAVVYQALIRSAAMGNRMPAAIEAFEELLPLLEPGRSEEFDRIYVMGMKRTQSHPLPVARLYRFEELARQLEGVRGIEGAVAECGCFRGHSSYIIASYLRLWLDGTGLHIFDSFAGLSAPQREDHIAEDDASAGAERLRKMTRPGHFAATLDDVKAGLTEFSGIEFHPGWIPQSFAGQPGRRYRFVHVDLDLFQPTRASFEYFWPRLVPGGVMLCDDFVWPGARRAVHEFAEAAKAAPKITAQQQAVFRKPG